MTTVTIEAEDLETLLFATGAIKAMEAALWASKIDPLAQMAKPKITAAHERLNRVLIVAKRQETRPELFTPATQMEIAAVLSVVGLIRKSGVKAETLGVGIPVQSHLYTQMSSLRDRGFVELGSYRESVIWASSGVITSADSPLRQHVRLTARGKEAIEGDGKVAVKLADGVVRLDPGTRVPRGATKGGIEDKS